MDKKTYSLRILLIVFCLGVSSFCFYRMNQSYDPLARYPYATSENRDVLLEYLDSDDIDYLITQQIRPETFLPFIEEPEFELRNAYIYNAAKKTQDASNDYIVNFVNKYRSNFSKDILVELLKHYSYVDLTTFYENEAAFNHELQLVADPSNPYVILNELRSVYKYAPEHLVDVQGYRIQSVVLEDLQAMIKDYTSIMNGELTLSVKHGYVSYEKVLEYYNYYNSLYAGILDYFLLPAGQSEYQLGYTISFEESDEWLDQCIQQDAFTDYDYTNVLDSIDEKSRKKLDWIEENAYRYGFIVRYPMGKEKETKKIYQPFVLRYVGRKTAKEMHTANLVMEQMDFPNQLQ